jgi:hypothetical protein
MRRDSFDGKQSPSIADSTGRSRICDRLRRQSLRCEAGCSASHERQGKHTEESAFHLIPLHVERQEG